MSQKLKYEKYNNSDSAITIDLHNGYSVIAISGWNNKHKNYSVCMFLKENTIDTWKFIEESEGLEINANYRTINPAILKYVSELLYDGFFEKHINRHEYELRCFEIGNEMLEKERFGNINA